MRRGRSIRLKIPAGPRRVPEDKSGSDLQALG